MRYFFSAVALFIATILSAQSYYFSIREVRSANTGLTDAQVEANATLVRYLTEKYKIEYLIGHSEYGVFRNSHLWKETNKNYFTGKADPGENFMKKVRALLSDLNLKSKP